ncbi:MAG TPA: HPr family phosphocarrier protein [Ktedonobacterales bacterium]|nr:HPr family phosphocarrier protein [Ktedonobacterales bacterium]
MSEQIIERMVTVGSASGLHARPAAVFVQRAKSFQSEISLAKNEKSVNGKSLLSVLTLGAEQGDQITLSARGEDAEAAISALAALLEENLG